MSLVYVRPLAIGSDRCEPAMTETMASVFPHGFDSQRFDRLLERHVVVAVFALSDWRPWAADAFDFIDAREHERVQRQRRTEHRQDLALAYALHRLVLARALDMPAARVPLGRDPHGRPVLEGMAVETSLSHADGHVAIAISLQGPVGVDIEPAARADGMQEIAGRVCHGDEHARIAACRDTEQGGALLDLWVRKEAFLKAAGVGLAREMDTFALPEGAPTVLHPGQTAEVSVDRLDLGPDVACALARRPGVRYVAGWVRPTGTSGGG